VAAAVSETRLLVAQGGARDEPARIPDGYPSGDQLTAALGVVLAAIEPEPGSELASIRRRRNVYTTTFPTEVITCVLGNGKRLRVFCKYGTAKWWSRAHGHRAGVAHEAMVYANVLRPIGASTPALLGTHIDSVSGATWLVLEYLDNYLRLGHRHPRALVGAAEWLGDFHRRAAVLIDTVGIDDLRALDHDYYSGWSRRTARYASGIDEPFPWLPALCERFEDFAPSRLARRTTVIHGEYFPENVLTSRTRIAPVDWESAAVAAGEIDLASLTEGWDERTTREAELAYRLARWPEGAPGDLDEVMAAARLYVGFRWLGDNRRWTVAQYSRWRFGYLQRIGEQLGLI